jgi:hypothetical protein
MHSHQHKIMNRFKSMKKMTLPDAYPWQAEAGRQMTAGKHIRQLCGAPIRKLGVSENQLARQIVLEKTLPRSGLAVKGIFLSERPTFKEWPHQRAP